MKKTALITGAVILLSFAAGAQNNHTLPRMGKEAFIVKAPVAPIASAAPVVSVASVDNIAPASQASDHYLNRLKELVGGLNFPLRDPAGRICVRFKPNQFIRFQYRF